ncbi:MAG: flagellar basal body-associated FliL family protein [Hyphomicrobiales bacterium]|jgi:flagellar FliL protein|nr:flagellar basal body-associated FliL family protein [Hyphomicrobiales bacterium]
MAVTTLDQAPPPAKKGPSLIIQIAVLLVLTGVAVGGGWFTGNYMRGEQAGEAAPAAGDHAASSGHGAAEAGGHGETSASGEGQPTIIPMAAITTNLAQPSNTWVRMEISLVFDKAPQNPELPDIIHQDFLTFVRTLKLHQIEGPSGFLHLRADLEERAQLRSDGAVKRILIRTLLLE